VLHVKCATGSSEKLHSSDGEVNQFIYTYVHTWSLFSFSVFPIVAERLKMKITTTHNFTTMVTGHGNVNAYLYRFKISNTPTCPCSETDQTTDHLLYECDLLKTQRGTLRSIISKSEGWPTSKHTLRTNITKSLSDSPTKFLLTPYTKLQHQGKCQAITQYVTTKTNDGNKIL